MLTPEWTRQQQSRIARPSLEMNERARTFLSRIKQQLKIATFSQSRLPKLPQTLQNPWNKSTLLLEEGDLLSRINRKERSWKSKVLEGMERKRRSQELEVSRTTTTTKVNRILKSDERRDWDRCNLSSKCEKMTSACRIISLVSRAEVSSLCGSSLSRHRPRKKQGSCEEKVAINTWLRNFPRVLEHSAGERQTFFFSSSLSFPR